MWWASFVPPALFGIELTDLPKIGGASGFAAADALAKIAKINISMIQLIFGFANMPVFEVLMFV